MQAYRPLIPVEVAEREVVVQDKILTQEPVVSDSASEKFFKRLQKIEERKEEWRKQALANTLKRNFQEYREDLQGLAKRWFGFNYEDFAGMSEEEYRLLDKMVYKKAMAKSFTWLISVSAVSYSGVSFFTWLYGIALNSKEPIPALTGWVILLILSLCGLIPLGIWSFRKFFSDKLAFFRKRAKALKYQKSLEIKNAKEGSENE